MGKEITDKQIMDALVSGENSAEVTIKRYSIRTGVYRELKLPFGVMAMLLHDNGYPPEKAFHNCEPWQIDFYITGNLPEDYEVENPEYDGHKNHGNFRVREKQYPVTKDGPYKLSKLLKHVVSGTFWDYCRNELCYHGILISKKHWERLGIHGNWE